MSIRFAGEGQGEVGPAQPGWEPEPYELPLVEPWPRRPPPADEDGDAETDRHVIVIDLA